MDTGICFEFSLCSGCPVFDGGRIIFNNELLPFDDEIQKLTFNYNMDGVNVVCYFTLQRIKEGDIELDNLNNFVKSRKGRSDEMPQVGIMINISYFIQFFRKH